MSGKIAKIEIAARLPERKRVSSYARVSCGDESCCFNKKKGGGLIEKYLQTLTKGTGIQKIVQ